LTRDRAIPDTSTASANHRALWASVAILVVVTLAAFWRVTGQDFVHWNDKGHVLGNPHLQPTLTFSMTTFVQIDYSRLVSGCSARFTRGDGAARRPYHSGVHVVNHV
jgi:hypothetical protein